jgi:large subunit ribosomal protein L10
MAKVAKWKIEEVEKMHALMKEYPVVGLVNMEGIPARQLQKMRALMRGDVLIKMSKKALIKYALEKAAKEEKAIKDLEKHLKGQPALIFSKINPFKLYKILEKNKTPAPPKPNTIAPKDIIVKKGETPFTPGPMLSELQQVGIPTTISGGKIAIKEDTVVVKEGEKISPEVAAVLTKLGIEPMEIGLELTAAYEDGTIFLPETLAIDEGKMISDIQKAYLQAVGLSVSSGFITKETAPLAIAKAFNDAKAVGIYAGVYEPEIIADVLKKAHLQMLSLASHLSKDALDEELIEKTSTRAPPAKPVEEEKKEEEKEKEEEEEKEKKEEVSEEEAIEGLGALFG